MSFALAALLLGAVAVYFPPKEFGKFSLALSVVQISCAAILSWPNQAYLRFGRESFRVTGGLGAALGARLTLHVIMFGLMLLLVTLFSTKLGSQMGVEPDQFLMLFVLALFLVPLMEIGLISAQACGRFFAYGIAPVVQRAIQLGAVFAVVFGSAPSWNLLLGFSILGYLASALLAWADVPIMSLRPKFSLTEISRAIQYAWALPLATLGAFLLQWMDLWFIRGYLDDASVGHYAWAYTFTLLVTGILVPMAAVLAPKAIDMELDKHVAGLRKLLGAIFSICMLSGALLPIVLAMMAGIGASVVPEKYLMSWPVVLVLSAALLCQMGMAFVEPVVYAQERLVPRMALIVMVMVLVKAIGNILLIGSIGMIGSAVATVLCYGVGMLLQWRLLRRHLGPNIPGSWPILASSVATMIFAASWQAGVRPEWFFALGGGLTIICLNVFRRAGFFSALPTDLKKLIGFRIYRWLVKA